MRVPPAAVQLGGLRFDVLEAHRRTCEYRPRPCKWAGCGAHVAFNVLAAHEGVCLKRVVQCPHPGCNATGITFDTLEAHLRTCEYRELTCKWPGCGAIFTSARRMAHENNDCVKRELKCPNGCPKNHIVFDELEAHRRTCQFETVACPYASLGCEVRMLRKAVTTHESGSTTKHNQLLLAAVCGLRQEVTAVKAEVNAAKEEVDASKKEVSTLKDEVDELKEIARIEKAVCSLS